MERLKLYQRNEESSSGKSLEKVVLLRIHMMIIMANSRRASMNLIIILIFYFHILKLDVFLTYFALTVQYFQVVERFKCQRNNEIPNSW